MPYRRLPNTDVARLKALKQAYQKGRELPPFKLAFSQSTFNKVQAFLPNFDAVIRLYKNTCATAIAKGREYPTNYKKAKLYISHFIQVMNMAIARGELHPNIRTFYGIDEFDSKVPDMNTEAEVIKWGEQVIAGESERLKKGMTPIANPTVAVVKVRFEQFVDAYHSKKINQKNNMRILNDVTGLRIQADEIILNVWNEVEKYFVDLPDDMMREKAAEYGVSYVYRRNELRRLSVFH
ncbi:MAG: hypothetical protein LBL04_04355 [Bacteroidales bacterium]|jgi:hypothetical protein|nr:hypothetical protein [Bacteroidales bacterium]